MPIATQEKSQPLTYIEILDRLKLRDAELQQQTPNDNLLVVSPYTTLPHLLDIRSVEQDSALLAMALTIMTPTRTDYATAEYHLSFNWQEVIQLLRRRCKQFDYQWSKKSFYVIAFRSQIPPETDRSHLIELDELSHQEATESGGLLK